MWKPYITIRGQKWFTTHKVLKSHTSNITYVIMNSMFPPASHRNSFVEIYALGYMMENYHLVKNISCKCPLLSNKVSETVLCKKEQYLYIETCVHQSSLFSSVALLTYDQTLGCFWGDRLNHPILMTVLLLLFLFGGQKELHGEFKFWWSDQISL